MSESAEEFLRETGAVPSHIGDAPELPISVPGMAHGDPMKPWKDIDVTAYVPMVKWFIQQPFEWAAKTEPAWKVDDAELESIDVPLTEAVQKCLYDLKLSKVAGNPYVALLAALATLTGFKFAAVKVTQAMREAEQRKNQGVEDPAKTQAPRSPAPSPQVLAPNQNRPGTKRASQTENGRMPGSGAAASSSVSPTLESRGSWSIESEPEDE